MAAAAGAEGRRIRQLRPPKEAIDPWKPLGVTAESERCVDGSLAPSLTIFLAGAECPFTCAHCDLWRFTVEGATPPGALVVQLREALEGRLPPAPKTRLKLYNASNFFEPRAVPVGEEEAMLPWLEGFDRVVVECHPRLVGDRCFAFAEALARRGVTLEVALGLESARPEVLSRLNKGLSLEDFDAAVAKLSEAGLPSRAFILVGAPYGNPHRAAEEAAFTAEHALEVGVETAVLIPVRGGNGELDRLQQEGLFAPPDLEDLERALDLAMPLEERWPAVVLPDLWDLEIFSRCELCFPDRAQRLHQLAARGGSLAPVRCENCEVVKTPGEKR
ncbi:MAG: hypothetical protein AAGD01_12705 [Acidobacteriota bacterium]